MKYVLNLLLISLLICPIHATLKISEPTREIYISLNGNDINADGSRSKPFRNIQPAIDYAYDGDVLIVLAGRYSGSLNRNLNFKGKALILQSKFPDSNVCMNNTIIDAEGIGYVIRFINDEGPNCVFQGFSIIPGDTSLIPFKGIPGFIEFSQNARPTTRRLKFFSEDSIKRKKAPKLKSARITKSDVEEFCLYDPFNQPFNITDYYGSGDLNKDGELDQMDLDQLNSILSGLLVPNIRADVDGSGFVDMADFILLDSAVYQDKILPGWWNQLSSEQEKNLWIDSIFKIDKTDQLKYVLNIFDCSEFSRQIQRYAFQEDNYKNKGFLDGSQTVYNLPIFYVSVNIPYTYGHAINAILIEDDPLNFENWRFIEPQNDYDVFPGGWNMPYNTYIHIDDNQRSMNELIFFVDENGWIFDTIKCFSVEQMHYPSNNYPYQYNPKLLEENANIILYEKQRDDMTRIMDIHLADQEGFVKPLTSFNHYSRLWNIESLGDSKYALLWSTKTDDNEGYLCLGTLDMNSLELSDVDSIFFYSEPYDPEINHAKFVLDSKQKSHVFWRSYDWNLYYATNSSGVWSEPEIISTNEFQGWFRRNNFDVISYYDTIVIVYLKKTTENLESIEMLKYAGSWHESVPIIENTKIQELNLHKDHNNRIHLVYPDWGKIDYPMWREDTCNNFHIYSDDATIWSVPELISSDLPMKTPKLLNDTENDLYLVYQEWYNDQFIPVWQKYSNNTWSSRNFFPVRPDANTDWTDTGPYTDANISADNFLYITWASENPDSIKIETYIEKCLKELVINLGQDTSLFINESIVLHAGTSYETYSWNTGQADSTIHLTASEMGPGSHIIEVTASDINGCSASDEIKVTVECYSYPNFKIGNDTTIFSNDTLMLNAGSGFATYSWSTGHTDSIIYINASDYGLGEHTFKITAADAYNCSATDEIIVTVECYTYPDLYIGNDTTIFINDTLMLNAGSRFATYNWSTGNTDSIIYIIASDYSLGQHTFEIVVADEFNCNASDEIVVTIVNNPIFTDQVSINSKIKFYPNPGDDEIIIEVEDIESPKLRLTIIHLTGSIIYTNELNVDDHNLTYNLDVSKYESGCYFVKIEDCNTIRMSKLIIK